MSCFVVVHESLVDLYDGLFAYTGVGEPLGNVSKFKESQDWAAFLWKISQANTAAFNYRYSHLKDIDDDIGKPHELHAAYKTLDNFRTTMTSRFRKRRPLRTPLGIIKLMHCLAYQIIDAPRGSTHYRVAVRLNELADKMAGVYVIGLPAYDDAPWG